MLKQDAINNAIEHAARDKVAMAVVYDIGEFDTEETAYQYMPAEAVLLLAPMVKHHRPGGSRVICYIVPPEQFIHTRR